MNDSRIFLTLTVRGWLSTSASMFTANADCIAVCLYSAFSTCRGCASRFSSMTMRMP